MAGGGMNTGNSAELIRSEIWSASLKEILRDEMMAQMWVDVLTEFPDGDQFTIPSIGQAQVDDYEEDQAVTYRPMDTGEYNFVIDKYLSSGTYITKKNQQNAFYAAQLESRFVPEQERAIMAHFETTTLAAPEVGVAANSNEAIDAIEHRWAGSGTAGLITLEDFARARFALKKAHVPDVGLVALVDPSVEYTINTLTNLVNVSDNKHFEGIVADGIATGMRFVKNVYGFDVYTSNYLADATDSALPQPDDSTVDFSSAPGKVNLFFSGATGGDIGPFKAAWRQLPEVDYEYNKDFQRHEYVTTARYGVDLYRPENMVRVVTKPTV